MRFEPISVTITVGPREVKEAVENLLGREITGKEWDWCCKNMQGALEGIESDFWNDGFQDTIGEFEYEYEPEEDD
jgi:hypothetical protein